MSRPRFLADHDLNEHIIDGVLRREPSIEFIRTREVGLSGRPDPEVLEYAATAGSRTGLKVRNASTASRS